MLTIGMPTYKDFDGCYFTIQALRLYQDVQDCEILVIDTEEKGCSELKKVCNLTDTKYFHEPSAAHTPSEAKNFVFERATKDYVLCLDSHILLAPNVIRNLKDYIAIKGLEKDLLQGPLLYDDMKNMATHFTPVWSGHMYGVWGLDPLVHRGEPFDITMQGMGLFCMKKASWPSFNRKFKGFGGEEGYMQEKVRQRGGRTLCLPFLKWVHRFGRPNGVPYKLSLIDRVVNYLIGWNELGLDVGEIIEHFSKQIHSHELLEALKRFEDSKMV